MKKNFSLYVRAMRLPFTGASLLPYVFGAFLGGFEIDWLAFVLGLLAVFCTHISANLFNDYADNASGADCQDSNYYGFFGGSKLIQEGVLTTGFYLRLALLFAATALLSLLGLLFLLGNFWLIIIVTGALFLAVSYSCKPLALSYHGLGELVITFLFGPAAVLGGAYLQGGGGISESGLGLSLVFGFLTAGILIANEIPDAPDDRAVSKNTLVVLIGADKGWLLYLAVVILAYVLLLAGVIMADLNWFALFSLVTLILPIRAIAIMRRSVGDKLALVEASKQVVLHQSLVGIIMILALL